MTLPPFDPAARCSKCAYDAVTTKYVAEVKRLTEEEREMYLVIFCPPPWPKPAHLVRTCARCGHAWWERPLDEYAQNDPS